MALNVNGPFSMVPGCLRGPFGWKSFLPASGYYSTLINTL